MNVLDKIDNILSEKSLSKEELKKVNTIRTNMQGFIGKEFAKKGTDEEVLELSNLHDELAGIKNKISDIEKNIKKRKE